MEALVDGLGLANSKPTTAPGSRPKPLPKENSNRPNDNSDQADDSDTASRETNSSIVVLPSIVSSTILPSFSFTIPGLDGSFRALKDSCSQSSFVTENLAFRSKFKTIESNVKLTINGFNGSKEYMSKVVEIPMKLSDIAINIPALVVPSINITLKLPGLGNIVESFENKGFLFADKMLNKNSDRIDNIQVLSGSDSSYCLSGRDVVFGCNPPSVYTDTIHGILLTGNVNHLHKNLKFLGQPNVYNSNVMVDRYGSCNANLPCAQATSHSFLCYTIIESFLGE